LNSTALSTKDEEICTHVEQFLSLINGISFKRTVLRYINRFESDCIGYSIDYRTLLEIDLRGSSTISCLHGILHNSCT